MVYFYEFINQANRLFTPNKQIHALFLLNGKPIFDLEEIPDTEKIIIVSIQAIFREIRLMEGTSHNQLSTNYCKHNADNELIFDHHK